MRFYKGVRSGEADRVRRRGKKSSKEPRAVAKRIAIGKPRSRESNEG